MIMTLRPTLKRVFQKLENIFYKRLCTGLPQIISPLLLPNKNSFSFVVNCQLSSIRSVRVGFTFLVHLMLINWKNFRFYTLLDYWIWSWRLLKWCPSYHCHRELEIFFCLKAASTNHKRLGNVYKSFLKPLTCRISCSSFFFNESDRCFVKNIRRLLRSQR